MNGTSQEAQSAKSADVRERHEWDTLTNAEIVRMSDGNAWHWHIAIVRELERLRGIGELPYTLAGVAGNLGQHSGDTARACAELERWGIVRRHAEPRWHYDGEWITLD